MKDYLDVLREHYTIILLGIAGLFLLTIVFSFVAGSHYFVDYLWYSSQEQEGLWWQMLWLRFSFYLAGVFLALLFYLSNYGVAFVRTRKFSWRNGNAIFLLLGGALIISIVVNGAAFLGFWETYSLATYAPDYGLKDPIYEIDASFYMFRLHWYQTLLTWIKLTLVIGFGLSFAAYLLPLYDPRFEPTPARLQKVIARAVPHLAMIVSLFVLVFSIHFYLQGYSIIYNGTSAKVAGASFVDVNARAHAYTIFSYLGLLFAVTINVCGFLYKWRLPAIVFAAWIVTYFIALHLYPGVIRIFNVNPNEFEAEKPYIEHSIDYTLEAYGLGNVTRKKFPAVQGINAQMIANNREIIDSIRLWDYRPIRSTLRQLQEIRQYYNFLDVDIDRYKVDDTLRQVMIAARELNKNSLPTRTRTWESRHLQYTHGYGIAMAPSNAVTTEGLPQLWVRDFPPRITKTGITRLTRPEIYYGELTDDYVVVKTSLKEIDYPLEQNFAETVYTGKGGVELGNGLRKLLIAWQFDTWKFLVSRYIRPDSRVLFRRNIHLAVRLLAPFLHYDYDPYVVLGKDGKLYWIMDAYTTSNRFPYSASFDHNFLSTVALSEKKYLNSLKGINYIRNSVKVVIDAYDGTVKFYLTDKSDPIAMAWAKLFPQLIKPLEQMPSFLLPHIRHPVSLFWVQAAIYTDYHMSNSRAFYNLEDRWQIATEVYFGKPQKVEPYYTVIKLPGEKKEEYILMLPFIPNNKDNMIAWMAVRCDYIGGDPQTNPYGKILVFDFPRTRQIYGPIQIESRIDQDPEISKDLTLWNQQGSRVIRGNLLVIPIENTLLYIEPIYLQSTNSPFPELRRVIAADANGLVMGKSLETALSQLVEHSSRSTSSVTETIATIPELNAKSLARKASLLLQSAQNAVSKGNWDEFGQKMKELQQLLNRQK